MNHQEAEKLLAAYLDGELGLTESLALEEHLKVCAECAAIQSEHRELRETLRQPGLKWRAPAGLDAQIRNSLKGDDRPAGMGWRWMAVAAAAAGLVIFGGVAGRLIDQTMGSNNVAREVAASHVRSLMANHMTDVPSSDQHTVKPWFNGKLDFTPTVKDLAAEGFPLVGGRLDYLNERAVAALLYKRNQHPINVFEWPENGESHAEVSKLKGYNIIHWKESGMAYWAISDLNAKELGEFVKEFRR